MRNKQIFLGVGLILVAFWAMGCTAGDPQFTAKTPAGFWPGLWHGMIAGVTFIISLFSDNITMYEAHNNGGWYNFGFLMGVIGIWGGGSGASWKSAERKRRDEEWAELGDKLELKVLDELKAWADGHDDDEWDEVEQKVAEKLKRKLKEWAEED